MFLHQMPLFKLMFNSTLLNTLTKTACNSSEPLLCKTLFFHDVRFNCQTNHPTMLALLEDMLALYPEPLRVTRNIMPRLSSYDAALPVCRPQFGCSSSPPSPPHRRVTSCHSAKPEPCTCCLMSASAKPRGIHTHSSSSLRCCACWLNKQVRTYRRGLRVSMSFEMILST